MKTEVRSRFSIWWTWTIFLILPILLCSHLLNISILQLYEQGLSMEWLDKDWPWLLLVGVVQGKEGVQLSLELVIVVGDVELENWRAIWWIRRLSAAGRGEHNYRYTIIIPTVGPYIYFPQRKWNTILLFIMCVAVFVICKSKCCI